MCTYLCHRAKAGELRLVRELIELQCARHCHPWRQSAEPHLGAKRKKENQYPC
jgi:hypothetical protein